MTEDAELLRQYAQNGSETAFTELVGQCLPLVYAAALRQVCGDEALAKDVAQSVFIDLARKAGSLLDRKLLAGWLYTSTRLAASKAIRADKRRRRREQIAASMAEVTAAPESQPDQSELKLVLDQAMSQLSAGERNALLLRYFQGKEFKEVGLALGISEDAARMRVTRGLAKLETILKKRGVTITAVALGTALATEAAAAVPVGLAASIAATALASAAVSGGATATVVKLLTLTKAKVAVIGLIAVAGVVVPLAVRHSTQARLRAANQARLRDDPIAKGRELQAAGKLAEAVAAFSEAVRRNPNSAEAHYLLGKVLADMGQREKALAELTEAIRLRPSYAEAFYQRGIMHSRRGEHGLREGDLSTAMSQAEYRLAIEDFTSAIKLKPDWAEPYGSRASSYFALTQTDAAFAHPKDPALADLKDAALADLKEAIRLNPQLAWAYLIRARILSNREPREAALPDFSQAIRLDPGNWEGLFYRCLLYKDLGKYEDAIEDLTKILRLKPGQEWTWARYYYFRADLYRRKGDTEPALADYTKAIELHRFYAEAVSDRGYFLRHLGRYEEALKDFSRAIEIDPDDVRFYLNRAWTYNSLHQFELAIKDCDKLLRIMGDQDEVRQAHPYDEKWAFMHRARARANLNETDAALADLEKALALDAQFADAILQRGTIYSRLHQDDRALADFNQALSLNPEDADVYIYRLDVNLRLGHDELAVEDARAYLKAKGWRETNSPYAALYACQISQRLGQAGAARELLDEAAANCDRAKWPYPIIRYLRHELSASELMTQAKDNDQQTEARCNIGFDLIGSGKQPEGLSHLRWVEGKGNKGFVEYSLAVTELRRLQQGTNVPSSK